MLKAVFFDLNGVLIKSEYLSTRFENEFGVSSNEFITALKEVMEIVRKPDASDMYPLWVPFLEKWQISLSEEEFLNFWFSGETVDIEAFEYVESLKKTGVKVFVLSNNFRERTTFYRSHFPEIFNQLDGAYFSWETGYVKPNREAVEFVLREHGLKPDEVVYFDDSIKNIEVAKEIGVDGQLWSDLTSAKQYLDSRR